MEFYYIDQSGQTAGPVSHEEISELYLNGVINGQTQVAQAGSQEWTTFQQLFQIPGARVPVAAPQRVAPGPHQGPYRPPQPQPAYAGHGGYPQGGYGYGMGGPGMGGPPQAMLPPHTVGVFASSAPWAFVTSIYWWVSAVSYLVILGLLSIFGLALLSKIPKEIASAFLVIGIIAVVTLGTMIAFCILPAIQSWKFGSNLSRLRSMPTQDQLEGAIRAQSSYLRTFSIFLILAITGMILIAVTAWINFPKSGGSSNSYGTGTGGTPHNISPEHLS
jgi:hypothetical protein